MGVCGKRDCITINHDGNDKHCAHSYLVMPVFAPQILLDVI